MPPKVDPEIKAIKKMAAAYKKTPEFKERMKAIGKAVAYMAAVNQKLNNLKGKD